MRRILLGALLLCCAGLGVAQAPTTAPPPSPVILTPLDFSKVTNDSLQTGTDLQALLMQAAGNMNAIGAQGNVTVAHVTDPAIGNVALDTRVKKLESAPAGTPGAVSSPPVEIPLVIPYGSSGTSTWTLSSTLAEYANVPRTRRIVEFTNVHQFRVCTSILSPGAAGSFIELDFSVDQAVWAELTAHVPINVAGLQCSAWTVYTGQPTDQFIRVSGAGSGTAAFEFISMQVK